MSDANDIAEVVGGGGLTFFCRARREHQISA